MAPRRRLLLRLGGGGGGRSPTSDLALAPTNANAAGAEVRTGGLDKPPGRACILSNVSMTVPSGHLMAIIGASGSGKTTLLNALAGRASSTASGSVLFNESPASEAVRREMAFVQQEVFLLPNLTVRDTLRFTARLRLPRSMPLREKYAMVEDVILELGLKDCAGTMIGSDWKKGISGGERRRVSIGMHLLTEPSVLFMDEPTTGLDAFSARSLVEILKRLCRRGKTIVISIHQPRSDVFALFDHITLLTRGRVAYSGPRARAVPFLVSLGIAPAANVNGAEFLIDSVTVDDRSPAVERETRARAEAVVSAWAARAEESTVTGLQVGVGNETKRPPGGPRKLTRPTTLEQAAILANRMFANMYEDRLILWGSLSEVLITAFAFGYIFYGLDLSTTGVYNRKALLYSCSLQQAYMLLVFIIWKLSDEMAVFDRERADKMYSVPALLISWFGTHLLYFSILGTIFSIIIYFLTQLRMDNVWYHLGIFIFGNILLSRSPKHRMALTRDFGAASMIGNVFTGVLSSAAGFLLPIPSIQLYLRWFEKIAFTSYVYKIFVVNEFSGRFSDCDEIGCNGDAVVRDQGYEPGLIAEPIFLLLLNFGALIIIAGMLLQFVPRTLSKDSARYTTATGAKPTQNEEKEEVPSTQRDGPPIALSVRSLSLSSNQISSTPILQSISAEFGPGKLNAILGSSGAGKSSLLQLLHARSPALPSRIVAVTSGEILHNGVSLSHDAVGQCTASVRQHDSHLFPALTARETLVSAALLRLPASLPRAEKLRRAEHVLVDLGLTECADTLVGGGGGSDSNGGKVKGLSGGEKRRLSIALALLSNPTVLLLDEPTSGLDATTARHLMRTLKSLATHQDRTVVCSLHQPSSDIFKMLDRVLLLARGGRAVYEGPADAIIEYFGEAGYPCPLLTNPTDFAVDLSSVDSRSAAAEESTRAVVNELVDRWAARRAAGLRELQVEIPTASSSEPGDVGQAKKQRLSMRHALPVLVPRSFKNLRRQSDMVTTRLSQGSGLIVIYALFYGRLGFDQASIAGRIGVLQQMSSLVFVGVVHCVTVFPSELRLFRFEQQDDVYSVETFFWTYTINELPFEIVVALFIASILIFAMGFQLNFFFAAFCSFALLNAGESIGIAFCSYVTQPGFSIQIINAVLSIFMTMQGFLSVKMPNPLKYLNYLSMLRYSARALGAQVFHGLTFYCTDSSLCQYQSGDQVLASLNMPSDSVSFATDVAIILAFIFSLESLRLSCSSEASDV
ncbi:P-loop containing nucleoside triphosphate hydrolase protein [Zopfochytrium polystomum]|nr:P-loop containing nucleoside triphosphate hydrolase protein [Zopfochytrium polystomum]